MPHQHIQANSLLVDIAGHRDAALLKRISDRERAHVIQILMRYKLELMMQTRKQIAADSRLDRLVQLQQEIGRFL